MKHPRLQKADYVKARSAILRMLLKQHRDLGYCHTDRTGVRRVISSLALKSAAGLSVGRSQAIADSVIDSLLASGVLRASGQHYYLTGSKAHPTCPDPSLIEQAALAAIL
jgi:hypothetical protein